MNKKTTLTFKSCNGVDTISYVVHTPEEKPRAIIQIAHGMSEYIDRYDEFAGFLNQHEILVCGNDHLGHGKSASSDDNLGYFAKKNGWECVVKDAFKLTKIMKKEYPDIPYFLLGHSMGSFVARNYITHYAKNIDGAILSGTSGKNSLCGVGIMLADIISLFKGEKYRSQLLDSTAFKDYNIRYENSTSKYDWLSRNKDNVDKYAKDKYCNYIFTAKGFSDVSKLLASVSSKKWYQNVPRDLPIYLISGDMDPVGNYGKGVESVYNSLKEIGVTDLSIKLFKDDHHEILNETDREVVYQDVLNWVESHIKNN